MVVIYDPGSQVVKSLRYKAWNGGNRVCATLYQTLFIRPLSLMLLNP